VAAVSASVRKYRGAAVKSLVPDLVMTLTTPPAVRTKFGVARWLTDLEFFYGFERDVNRGALAPHLVPQKKPLFVITPPSRLDVVEDSALAIDVNFIAVRDPG